VRFFGSLALGFLVAGCSLRDVCGLTGDCEGAGGTGAQAGAGGATTSTSTASGGGGGGADTCGDGVLDPQEECDDGNGADGDECSADCRVLCCAPPLCLLGDQARPKCYRYYDLPQTYAVAASTCAAWCPGGRCRLAIVDEVGGIARFETWLKPPSFQGFNFAWVGALRVSSNEPWFEWVDGAPLPSTSALWFVADGFCGDEPTTDPMNDGVGIFDCPDNGSDALALADEPASASHHFICERLPAGEAP
jgi:cysteine-rich repeat protein